MDTSCYEQFLSNVNGVKLTPHFSEQTMPLEKHSSLLFWRQLKIVVVMPHINVKYLFFERFCFVISLKEQ